MPSISSHRMPFLSVASLAIAAVTFAACDKTEATPDKSATTAATLAPSATALPAPKPASVGATKLKVDTASSKVDFVMEAPKEKIIGHVPGTSTGELQIDMNDVTRSTGVLTVDLSAMSIYQAAPDKDGKFGEEKKVEKQNEHAKNWLEIGSDSPADKKKENSTVKFSITSIETSDEKSLMKLTGAERKVSLNVTGDFLLHGHKSQKTTTLAATFKFDGDKLVGANFKSTKPFTVNLVEHDVKPRDAVGKLLLKGLEALSSKVGKEAMVSLDVSAAP